MSGFLVLYKRQSGEYQIVEYDGSEGDRAALDHRLLLESEGKFAEDKFEIAVLSADSLESVKETHSRYFYGKEVQFIEPQ
ncbi:hypothetical protein IU459_23260 [Nocardia amamiensis]|uniref:Uncharacterized protein n=1 Tax=Nocardia amamiensis TaxID=404578 RepID=A0ABS0CV14_9NOCA|nr:hypothetical protein [Nocardia amamiensis]MBF6300441.1 hypothetical protein [Nocardia amamiensis]